MKVDTKAFSRTKGLIPMRSAVLGALGMAFAWGVIAGSVGLNALIKANQEKSRLKKLIPSPTVVTIDTNDVYRSGVVLTTVAALIALISFLSIVHLFLVPSVDRVPQIFRIQAIVLAFCAVWLFATLIPFTVYFATRSAKVTASLNGIQLPASLVNRVEQSLGSTSVYHKIGYLRLVAVLPWITTLFTVIAAIVLFIASSRTTTTETTEEGKASASPSDTHAMVEKEKEPEVKA